MQLMRCLRASCSSIDKAVVSRLIDVPNVPAPCRSFQTSAIDPLGFIGLGNMGSRMATNLLKSSRPIYLYDTRTESVADVCERSPGRIFPCASPREVAQKVTTLVTMLPSSPHVRQVYCNPDTGVLAAARPGTLLIDCSTIDPGTAREVTAQAAEAGCAMVDAPVSGGVIGAQNSTLTFMVGGSREDFGRAVEILRHMGARYVHCGDVGTGQVAKLCNNLVLAVSMAAVAEGLTLGTRLGMDPKVLSDIFNTSSARCWSSDTYNPCPGVIADVPSSRDYTGGFAVSLMVKDLGLAASAAHQVKAPIPLGGLALELYQLLDAHGLSNKDFSVIFQYLSAPH